MHISFSASTFSRLVSKQDCYHRPEVDIAYDLKNYERNNSTVFFEVILAVLTLGIGVAVVEYYRNKEGDQKVNEYKENALQLLKIFNTPLAAEEFAKVGSDDNPVEIRDDNGNLQIKHGDKDISIPEMSMEFAKKKIMLDVLLHPYQHDSATVKYAAEIFQSSVDKSEGLIRYFWLVQPLNVAQKNSIHIVINSSMSTN